MSLDRKIIGVTLSLGGGRKFSDNTSTKTLDAHRVSAAITNSVGDYQGALDLRVYGMTQSAMNAATTLQGAPFSVEDATVVVTAGSTQAGMTIAYTGNITDAWADYSGSPDVAFRVVAFGGATAAAKPVPPASYQGGADVAGIMGRLAQQMGLAFENNGVAVQVSDPYLPGTAYEQAERLRDMAGIFMVLEGGTLAIWPPNGVRGAGGAAVPVIGPDSGLVGYPVLTQAGVNFRSLYGSPYLRCGAKVEVKTSVLHAAGVWQVIGLAHNLETELPGGQWFTTATTNRVTS
ncbi:MAG: baseplate hub protein [Janthinobacterium lividum]